MSGDLSEITGGNVKIGAETHRGRNIGIVVGVLVLVVGIVAFTMYSNSQDAAKLTHLESFRALYADKCDAPAYREPAPQLIRDTYLRSESVQAVVAKQQAALQAGTPCEEVARALKTADFLLPSAKP
jgi:hypothetical protein